MFGKGILIAVALGFVATLATADEQPSDQECLKIANEWMDAYSKATKSRDAAGVADRFVKDGFTVRMDGVYSGREAIRQITQDAWKTFTDDPAKIIYAKKATDGSVIAVGSWSGMNKGPNGAERLQGYFTDVLVKDGGDWRSIHEINVDVQP